MPKILCVHQGYELYGSDRTFLQSVAAIKRGLPEAHVTAVIPREGVLSRALAKVADDLQLRDLLVLRKADIVRAGPTLFARLRAATRDAASAIASHDLTYINSIVCLDYVLATRSARRPCLLHVHELPTGPARWFFAALVRTARADVIFNSEATRRAFNGAGAHRSWVLHNGTAIPPEPTPPPEGPLRVLLIGRINAWKGHLLLLDAIAGLPSEARAELEVRLVGDVFTGQERYREAVLARIGHLGLERCVTLHPFDPEPAVHFSWANVVVVPSTKPEPFGLVAIEAMAHGRPVVAADHGGLAEIVVDGETGTRFTPNDPAALGRALMGYVADPSLRLRHGRGGRARALECFDERVYERRIAEIVAERLTGSSGR